jgi:hypothetical protein
VTEQRPARSDFDVVRVGEFVDTNHEQCTDRVVLNDQDTGAPPRRLGHVIGRGGT